MWWQLSVAVFVVVAALALRLGVLNDLETRVTYVTFFPAVLIAAVVGGVPAGVLAAALSAVSVAVWVAPVQVFTDWLALGVFCFGAALIVATAEGLHRAWGRVIEAEAQARHANAQKQMAEALRESEELWKAVFEGNPTMYFMVDAAGITLSVNAFGAEQLGCTPDELVGSPVLNVFYEPDREAVRRNVDCCFAQLNRAMSWEARKVRKDGKVLWVRETARSVLLKNGPVILVACEVLTEQKRAEEAARTLEILNKVSSALALECDLHRLVQVVTDAGVELTGAEFGAFFYNVINEENESYMLYTLSGAPPEAFSKFPMPRNTAVFAPTFNGEGIVRSNDITKDPRYGKNKPRAGMPEGHLPVRSYLAVPVTSRSGEVLGGLFFGHAKAGVFSERSERGLLGLAAEAAVAIDNARLTQATQREMQERRRAEEALRLLNATLEQQVAERTEALRRSERYLAEAQTLSHTGSWAADPATGKTIYWSEEMFRIYGLDPRRSSAPDRKEFSRFLLPEDRDLLFERIERAYREKAEFAVDHRIVLPHGIVKHLHVIGHPVLNDTGEVVEYIGTSLDVTERKRAEEALRHTTELLNQGVRVGRLGIFEHDHDADIIHFSPEMRALFGWSAQEPVTLPAIIGRVHPKDRAAIATAIQRAHDPLGDGTYEAEYRIVHHDDTVRWVTVRSRTFFEGEGSARRPVRTVGAKLDITDRKRDEERLRTLTRELDHRVKNSLARFAVVVQRTRACASTMAEYVAALEGRIQSMVRTQSLLSRSKWGGVGLMEILRDELGPYVSDQNVNVGGLDLLLNPEAAQALTMVIHELATNAAKYGALSSPSGQVTVAVALAPEGPADGKAVTIMWLETGGPNVSKPQAEGYGSQVIRELLGYELGGQVELAFDANGVRCNIRLPLARVKVEAAPDSSFDDPI